MTPRLAAGWLPEVAPPDSLLRDHAQRLGLGLVPVSCYAMMDPASTLGVFEQGITPTCVSQAVAAAARLRRLMMGDLKVQLPSRRWLHRHARGRDAGRHFDLPNTGTYVSTACAVTRELGWPAEEHWPWDDDAALSSDAIARNAWLDKNPPASVRRHAYDQVGAIREHAIVGIGDAKVEFSKAALAANFPIVFGATVDEAYKVLEEWEPHSFDGPIAGGHAQFALGYDSQGVIVQNSWNCDWGVGGFAILSWDCWVRQCRDLRVIELVERATT